MVEIKFPDIVIPAFKISKGRLLNVSLLGVGLVIPPLDITFWPYTKILSGFTLFNTDDITKPILDKIAAIPKIEVPGLEDIIKPILDAIAAIPKVKVPSVEDITKGISDALNVIPEAVWNLAKAKLDELAADYYERHSEET